MSDAARGSGTMRSDGGPAPSPAERCATCGHGADDHHFSSRDDQYWCDKCSGNSWMHPFDYTPPPATRGIGRGSVSEAQPPAEPERCAPHWEIKQRAEWLLACPETPGVHWPEKQNLAHNALQLIEENKTLRRETIVSVEA